MQSLRDDIAYLRALAAEGRTAPFLGGSILIAAGVIFGACSLMHWAIATRLVALPTYSLAIMWLTGGVGFGVAMWLVKNSIKGRPGAEAISNKASSWAWASAPPRCR